MSPIVIVLSLAACGSAPVASKPPGPPVPAPVVAPAPAGLPTAAELHALIDRATEIEARSAPGEEPAWTKVLTDADRALLRTGIGQATVSDGVPRCLPTVIVSIYVGEQKEASLGSFCERDGPMRLDLADASGSVVPEVGEKVLAALAPPRD